MERVLLVEGKDDEHVCYALFEKHGIPETFKIIDCNGISKLFEGLPVRIKNENSQSIGIIIDANSDIQERWKELKDILTNESYKVPDEPLRTGTILTQELHPTIGVWLMPDNQINGMLEDFMRVMIPENDRLFPIAEKTIADIERENLNRYTKGHHHSKALVHTWLAWQEDPGTPLGLSITKKYFETDRELVKLFLSWIETLFNIS